MIETEDFSQLTLVELLSHEKKYKKKNILTALLVGFLFGIMIFGVAKNGFGFLYIFLPLVLIIGIVKGSQKDNQKLKEIRAVINEKTNKEN